MSGSPSKQIRRSYLISPYEKRLDAAASLLGIDLNLVSPDAGYS